MTQRLPSGRAQLVAEVLTLFKQGLDHREIAQRLNRPTGIIRKMLRRRGIVPRLKHGRPPSNPTPAPVDITEGKVWERNAVRANAEFLAALSAYFDNHHRRAA